MPSPIRNTVKPDLIQQDPPAAEVPAEIRASFAALARNLAAAVVAKAQAEEALVAGRPREVVVDRLDDIGSWLEDAQILLARLDRERGRRVERIMAEIRAL